ncbi:MAG: PaaI family thioesterase [Myxococcales bacterium]|nr:PaaI family thioesterase [Myxococcales bacterium]
MSGIQREYAPNNQCFGCGPANDKGLRIDSVPAPDGSQKLVCDWMPEPHHVAFGAVLNGGIIGTLLDCHSNWAAAWTLMRVRGLDAPPCTVTADFHVKLKRPTPLAPLHLEAEVVSLEGDTAVVEARLESGGKVTATCRGTFVAVKEGHPAFHRW